MEINARDNLNEEINTNNDLNTKINKMILREDFKKTFNSNFKIEINRLNDTYIKPLKSKTINNKQQLINDVYDDFNKSMRNSAYKAHDTLTSSMRSYSIKSHPWWCEKAQTFRDEKEGLIKIPISTRTPQQKSRIRVLNGKIEGIKNNWIGLEKSKISRLNDEITHKNKIKFWKSVNKSKKKQTMVNLPIKTIKTEFENLFNKKILNKSKMLMRK